MKKTYRRSMGAATIISLLLTTTLPTTIVGAAAGQVTKVGGSDSYETAAIVATVNWTSSKDVVLVCGEGYADAVSATVLAKQLNAPILLTQTNSLNINAKNALDKLKPQNIYIIGGAASVSNAIRDQLKSSSYNLIELGGKNRYETNIAVANQLVKLGVKADQVMLVSGEGFSDVLSATPVAAAKGQILLLGNNDKNTMKQVLDFVKANNSKVTVIGTNNSIKESVYNDLGATARINGGSDRFQTNLNVLNNYNDYLNSDKLFVANASGDRYADALIAASLAGKNNAPLVIVDGETDPATSNAINYIKSKANKSTDLNVIGENGTVSEKTISQINSAVTGSTPTDSATVKSVSTNGLNQIKVVFNTEVDEDSAEKIANYQIDGINLGITKQSEGTATLQDDKRTVLITLSNPFEQYKKVNFVVKNAVMDKGQINTIPKFEQEITFSDITAPTIESITARGGNKLIVKFSEPIRLSKSDLSYMKINRQSVNNFGLNTSQTVFGEQSDIWADKIEFYFNSPLPIGNNTFTIPNGESRSKLDNAAGYPIQGTSVNFNIESAATGNPKVTSITSNNLDTIYIKYDRAMDKQTALEDSNYKINGTTVSVDSTDISFDEGSNDTVVKIKDVARLLKTNQENLITVKSNIEDTYGNEVNETNMNLYIGSDTAKPQVSSVSIIDGDNMRVKFNKDVSNSYATNKGNYKILNSDGTDITYKIDSISSVYADGNSKRIFNIKFTDSTSLKGSNYTITIKNITDTNSVPNIMDEYTTQVNGLDSEGPKVTEIVKRIDNSQGVAIFFNKVMDESSLTNPKNYYFKDGTGETRTLPRSASITPSLDNKSVTIEFPSSFVIGIGSSDKFVVKMGVGNVTDKNGNSLDTVAHLGEIKTGSTDGPSLVDDTAKLTFEGDDIKVKVSLTSPIDILNLSDFTVNSATPDSGTTVGNDVILTFKAGVKDNQKINVIRNAGSSTTVSISNTNSVDAAGRRIKSGSDILYIPPVTVPDSWLATGASSKSTVTITFNQEIDNDVASAYDDDFIFTSGRTGQKLIPVAITVDGRNIIYRFNNGSITNGDSIDVRANENSSNINIRSNKHGDSGYTTYTPSKNDLKGRTLIAH